jgi:RNA polymerase sigma-70 factor, ECF subfamily
MNSPTAELFTESPFVRTGLAIDSSTTVEAEDQVVALFGQFRAPVIRYVFSIGLSMHDAEEVAQEVFLALLRHFRLGRSRHNLRGWIFKVAHNLALKRRETEKRRNYAMSFNPLDLETHSDPAPNPEEHASFVQRQRRLSAVVKALPEQDQCCLRLRAEGIRYREISAILGISLGSVSISLSRSLARLARSEEV